MVTSLNKDCKIFHDLCRPHFLASFLPHKQSIHSCWKYRAAHLKMWLSDFRAVRQQTMVSYWTNQCDVFLRSTGQWRGNEYHLQIYQLLCLVCLKLLVLSVLMCLFLHWLPSQSSKRKTQEKVPLKKRFLTDEKHEWFSLEAWNINSFYMSAYINICTG